MNQEILDRIDALAIKLGTTAEYLWPKLVGHAQVSASATVAGFGFAMALLLIVVAVIVRRLQASDINEKGLAIVMVLGISATLFIGCTVSIIRAIPDLFYPEATALRSILR